MIKNRMVTGSLIGITVLLAGCAGKPAPVTVAAAPTPPPAPAPMPEPPDGADTDMTIPARLADGSYATPNRALSDAAAIWHVRAALNVAALGCTGADQSVMIDRYNAMLKTQKAPLAKAQTALISQYAASAPDHKGQAAYDDAMTRLYNYFAQPTIKAGFCAAAGAVLAQSTTVEPAGLTSFATGAVATLDAPFVDFYRRYDAYRVALAGWRRDRMLAALEPVDTQPVVAAAARVAVETQPPQPAPHLTVDPSVLAR